MRRRAPAALWCFGAIASLSYGSEEGGVLVKTASLGYAKGVRSEGADAWLGLKYATVPVRFEAAVPFEASHDMKAPYDATRTGPWCHQASFPEQPDPSHEYSEDCLFINVWRPTTGAEGLPCMLWIHGGSFTQGGGADRLFDGRRLAVAANAVVATLNYRLGPLGFLVHDETGHGGMGGVADAIAALRWLHANAASFGGDARRVTVFGESAGGCAACVMALSPLTKGLLETAIVQSGPCVGPWGPESDGVAHRDALFAALGATSVDDLRRAAVEDLYWRAATGGYFFDDSVLTAAPNLTEGNPFHVSQLVLGGTSFDGTAELLPEFPANDATAAEYLAASVAKYGAVGERVAAYYDPTAYDGASAAFVEADADHVVTCPNIDLARAAARGSTTTRLYRFEHMSRQCDLGYAVGAVPDAIARTGRWASHGAELVFVFNNTRFSDPLKAGRDVVCNFTAGEAALSRRMMGLWADVATRRDMASSWPDFRDAGGAETTLLFRTPELSLAATDVKTRDCRFWASLG